MNFLLNIIARLLVLAFFIVCPSLGARPFVLTIANTSSPYEGGDSIEPVFSVTPDLSTTLITESVPPRGTKVLTLSLDANTFWLYNPSTGWVSHNVEGVSDAMLYWKNVGGSFRQVLVLGSSSEMPQADAIEIFKSGFYLSISIGITAMMYALLRGMGRQNHLPS